MTDRLSKLHALEDVLWESIGSADPEKRAPLVAQFRAVLAEIAVLSKDSAEAGDPVDEIARRRAARRTGTA